MRVLVAVNALIWAGLAWQGFGLLQGVTRQHVPGFPNSGQVTYYLYVPLSILIVAFAGLAIWKFTRFRRTALALEVALLAFVLPFLLTYTGGV